MKSIVASAILSLALGLGSAFAQGTAPATPSTPPAKTGHNDRAAVSKSCTDQANAKGLHGKARKKFRSACKKAGGKMQ